MGRPKLYENSADRQKAHRARNAVADIRLVPSTLATVDLIAAELDCSRAEVLNSMVNFALLNRNWRVVGLFGKRLPRAKPPSMKSALAE